MSWETGPAGISQSLSSIRSLSRCLGRRESESKAEREGLNEIIWSSSSAAVSTGVSESESELGISVKGVCGSMCKCRASVGDDSVDGAGRVVR